MNFISDLLFNYLNAIVAFIMFLCTYPFNRNLEIWIFGGINGEMYADNSKVFYEYMIKNHHDIKYLWVAKKNSPAYCQAKGMVIIKGSVLNYYYLYKSKVTIFSDTFNSDIAPYIYIMPFLNIFYFKVFKVRLNHGTIAFKHMPRTHGIVQKIRDNILLDIDLNTASTELEFEVMSGYMKKNSVVLTGSARNDEIEYINNTDKTIFIAPTWRTWLPKYKSITETDFYTEYCKLLSNQRLIESLKKHNIKINFFLHHMVYKFKKEFEYLNNDRVCIMNNDIDIKFNIISSSLMITDYSSIISERYFVEKPMLFFQFDQERYSKEIGSYINLKKDIYGDVCNNENELIDKIIFSIESSFPVSNNQLEGEKYFVHYKDKNNCKRIYNEIIRHYK